MGNFIINNLLDRNKEFNFIYNTFLFKGKIKTFKSISNLLKFNDCFKEYDKDLNYIFSNDLNLLSPYITAINLVRAIMGKTVLGEYIEDKPKIVYGKQYLTKNNPNIYDCTSLWIETEKYIIDPVLGIIVDINIKDKMFYKDIFVDKKYNILDNVYGSLFCLDEVIKHEKKIQKIKNIKDVKYPTTINELYKNTYKRVNKSTLIRDYLLEYNPKFYNKLIIMIEQGIVTDLSKKIRIYDKYKLSERFNPDLTLGNILRKGLNYGRCGLVARAFGGTVFKDVKYTYSVGTCKNIIGSKNSYNGNHAWLEVGDKIIDTSLMLEIPIEYKSALGYKTVIEEECDHTKPFNSKINPDFVFDEVIHLYDVAFERRKNSSLLVGFDFAEFLPDLIDNNYKCKIHFTKSSLTIEDLLDEEDFKYNKSGNFDM